MDPVSDVPKRNMLAQHLHEVVDILEQKVYEFMKKFWFTVLTMFVQLPRVTRLPPYMTC